MINSYIKLGIAALIPVAVSCIFFLLDEKTAFRKLKYKTKQVIYGLVFGIVAIIGTEWGIPVQGAQVNVRDAAPLCAGLLFGGPAGIIAGLIGGFERWIAVYWGVGYFTRVACTVSTIFAGFYAAQLRKHLFDNERPSWGLALATGAVMEVFHLSMVFVTNFDEATKAAEVVKACSIPMTLASGLSVMLAAIALQALSHKQKKITNEKPHISQLVQRGLLITVAVTFVITSVFLYFVQTGIARNDALNTMDRAITDISRDISMNPKEPDEWTEAHTVGQNGFAVIAYSTGEIISAPEGSPDNIDLGQEFFQKHPQKKLFSVTLEGVKCFGVYRYTYGYCVIAVLPQEEVLLNRDASLYVNSFLEIMVFASLFVVLYELIHRVVVSNIRQVNKGLDQITQGELDTVIDVRQSHEFDVLSNDINATVDSLKGSIETIQKHMDEEMQVAKSIQTSALPNVFPAFPGRKDFDIFASMDPAKEVGGDFYDFYLIGNKLYFLVADVSGKGIPAAMFMMRAKTQLKSLAEAGHPINEVFTMGNNSLCSGNDAGMFVTAFMGSLDLETGLIEYSNAGHNPPLVRHQNGTFEYLKSKVNFVLGGMEGIPYKKQTLQLEKGDVLFIYTDGVTEATNIHTVLYGEDRLQRILNQIEYNDMHSLCDQIKVTVDDFTGEAQQFDDITMMGIKFLGSDISKIHFDEGKIEDIPSVTAFVEEKLEPMDCPYKVVLQLGMVIDEVYSNIVRYGYKNTQGPVTVTLEECQGPHGVILSFVDEGIPYNPVIKEDPDVTLSAEERQIGGLGIFMVKKFTDDMTYEYKNDKNVLKIRKNF